MILDIVIPSKGRQEKLTNCLNSILSNQVKKEDINIHIFLSDSMEYEYFSKTFQGIPFIVTHLMGEYRVPDFWNDYLSKMTSDLMCYINDDVYFFPDTLKELFKTYQEVFPNLDGILGLNQVNIKDTHKVDAAFGVIGRNYATKFPFCQVFCPDYNRFYADWELWQYAKEIGKFHFGEQVQIEHYHPCTNKKYEDETHHNVRKWLAIDKEIFKKRQQRSLLWGRNYNLITKE